jgi:hypothetical protein
MVEGEPNVATGSDADLVFLRVAVDNLAFDFAGSPQHDLSVEFAVDCGLGRRMKRKGVAEEMREDHQDSRS